MKLGLKLPLVSGASLLVVAAAALFGIRSLNQSLTTYATTVQSSASNERDVGGVLVGFKTQVQEWKNTLLRGKDPEKLQKHWSAFENEERAVAASTKKLLAALPEGSGRSLVGQFAQAHEKMGAGYRKGFEAFKASGFDPLVADTAVAGMDRDPAKLLGQAEERIAADSAAVAQQAAEGAKRATTTSLALILAACVTGILASLALSRMIARPLRRAVESARAVADGNLEPVIGTSGIVTGAAVSADGNYSGMAVGDVSVVNLDDDTAGVAVSAISDNTTEAGATATFSVVLTSQPTASVSDEVDAVPSVVSLEPMAIVTSAVG